MVALPTPGAIQPAVVRLLIDDPADPGLDDFRDLSTADRRPDRPGGRGVVIAEGVVVVRRLLASAYPVRAVLGVRRRLDDLEDDLASACVSAFVSARAGNRGRELPAYEISAELMAQVVGFHLNRGVLATADRVAFPPVPVLVKAARTIAVLEGVNDHENLGAIFRNAAALGVDAVVLGPGCADPLYRRSVRVSMGTVLRVPFAQWPGTSAALIGALRADGFTIAALTPSPNAITVADAAARAGSRGDRAALLLGAEGSGLSDEALAAADELVRIPMADGVDSLNVATAGAIAFAAFAGPAGPR